MSYSHDYRSPSGRRCMPSSGRNAIRRRRRRRRQLLLLAAALLIVALIAALTVGIVYLIRGDEKNPAGKSTQGAQTTAGTQAGETQEPATSQPSAVVGSVDEILKQADRLAASYDYDAAIERITSVENYASDERLISAVAGYEQTKSTLVAYDITQICHVFYHSLIVDTDKAFSSYKKDGYNEVMTTVREFNLITQQMYEKGYVLVSLHQMADMQDGVFTRGKIMLPPGKIPFVLSIDDVSYYEYMDGHGFANRIVIDEDGYPTCEMDMEDGTVRRGDFDVVPLIETFLKEHPDFSYKGARGAIALTGYDGILGYRTSEKYGDKSHPDYKPAYDAIDLASEKEKAKAVAARMEELGWEFASHSWGHQNMTNIGMEHLKKDTKLWMDEVNSLLGNDTDILIFAFGADIGPWQGYTADNEKFAYLKSQGFNYFCNVDSNQPWVQFNSELGYLRQGRINFDGYTMHYRPGKCAPFFDAASVYDPARPPFPET